VVDCDLISRYPIAKYRRAPASRTGSSSAEDIAAAARSSIWTASGTALWFQIDWEKTFRLGGIESVFLVD
jgi:hypothetical protein